MSVEYDVRSPSTSRASSSPVTSQMSMPRKVISLETGSLLAQLADPGDGVGDDPVERPGQPVGHAVELGEVDAAGPRHEPTAHGSLDGFQQRHEERVRCPPPNPVSGTARGPIFPVRAPQVSTGPDAASATISASDQAPSTPGAAAR